MQEFSRKLPTYLFIQFNDCLRYINVENISGHIKQGGRKIIREGSTNDREFVAYVDNKKFITFND